MAARGVTLLLSRYKIYRGTRPKEDPLPAGIRQDIRKHIKGHCLHPDAAEVSAYLSNPTAAAWRTFKQMYMNCLEERYKKDPAPFKKVAESARKSDVYLGCNCPTAKNPDLRRCHTFLALQFMHKKFPSLKVKFPTTR